MRFLDTNIAIYSVSTDPEGERKQRISEVLLSREAGSLVVSIQLLVERLGMGKRNRQKPNSIANGLVKLALAVIVFGISYVLFFNFCFQGN